MAEFDIRTSDNVHTYSSTIPVGYEFEAENNNAFSDTQGFLRKAQKGNMRWIMTVTAKVSESTYETVLIPMLTYASDVVITCDRNIPGRGNTEGTFVFENMAVVQEFPGSEYEVKMKFTEVIY